MKWLERLSRGAIRSIHPRHMPPGFTRMGDYQPDDVFIAGYPKSGNTWMQLLVAGIVYGLDPKTAPDTLIQELVPDVHYKAQYKRFVQQMSFKTHDLPRPEYRRVINIVRDGRDVVCSFRYFCEAMGMRFDIDQVVGNARGGHFGSWADHVDAWNRNPYGAERIVVRYEDLIDDCVGQLTKIAEFLGVSRKLQELEHLASATELQRMKDREGKFGWDNKAWPSNRPFVRQGRKGGFRSELTAAQIRGFEMIAGRTLAAMGYTLDSLPKRES